MRRRFTLAIVGVVAGALLVAGVGTLALLTIQARHNARSDVRDLAARIATEAGTAGARASGTPTLSRLQAFLKRTQDLSLIVVSDAGVITGTPPRGIPAADLNGADLLQGTETTGFHASAAWAAAPFTVRNRHLAAVVTQSYSTAGGAALYLLLACGVALLVGFAVAETLARRITRPLVSIQTAAGRIAQGDLGARAPEPRQSYPELTSLTASVNAMADNLERLRGQERQFLLSISHDLRTPLTSIKGFAEALADGTTTDTAKAAEIIAAQARRLERLVSDLLDMAKLDAHEFTLHLQPTDLWEVVGDTAGGFAPRAHELGLELTTHPPVGPVEVEADPERLAQVVANLVENASKYATSRVDVATFGPAITIDDDGPGIPAEDLPRVFDRMWTNGRGVARQVGSGLGLAIVAELVHAMNGEVRAESPVPGSSTGTRLVVTLRDSR